MYSGHWSVVMAICLCVCLSLAAFQHYCTDPGVSWGNGMGALWLSTTGRICNRCMGCVTMTTAPNAKCQRVLVLAVCAWFRCSMACPWCSHCIKCDGSVVTDQCAYYYVAAFICVVTSELQSTSCPCWCTPGL